MTQNLIDRDLSHIWHPCSQMKDYEAFKPLTIAKAQGSYLELINGQKIIDAISSWWCKSLGHGHPRLQNALQKQMYAFEHVILANTTNEVIVELSEALAQLTHSLKKVFYAGDGACAVEIAMKMSLHARTLQAKTNKTKFIALQHAYHGETFGTMSISDVGLYRLPYQSGLWDSLFIPTVPYVSNKTEDLWKNCEAAWLETEKFLAPHLHTTTALIVEPIIQGSGGMLIYSQDFLKRLRKWTQQHDIHLIADEIMTGMGRTGKMLACEYADIEPDFLCLSKGLTSGWMAFSAVLTRDDIYELFYDDYQQGKSFLHSHTYSGNALAAAIALEVLKIMREENICLQAEKIGVQMSAEMNKVANKTGKLKNIRQLGAMIAADLDCDPKERMGFEIYKQAVKLGALLRPLGNTIYWMPPLNTQINTLKELGDITTEAILKVM